MLIGRRGVGKSTIIRTILKPSEVTQKNSSFERQQSPVHKKIYIFDNLNKHQIMLSILDTPGLDEQPSIRYKEINEIISVAKLSFKKVNLICFVSKAGETTNQDIDTFKAVKRELSTNFSICKNDLMIILTHSEKYDKSHLKKFERNLQTNPKTTEFANACGHEFNFNGALVAQEINSISNIEIREQINAERLLRIENFRFYLIDKLFSTYYMHVGSEQQRV